MLIGVFSLAGAQAAQAAQAAATATAPSPAAPRPPVSADDPAGAGGARREIRAQLKPLHYTTLAAEIGARIRALPVSEGGRFRQGQPLVNFDCSLQQAQVNKARAAVDAANTTWQANQRLNELKSVSTVELNVSHADLAKAQADLAAEAAVVRKCTIVAPFPGRVATQKVREDQFVQPGQALLDIIDDSSLDLEFLVPSRWLIWMKPDQHFQVQIDETGKTYPARIKQIGASVDPVSQSIKVTAVIDGHFPELMAGMSGLVLLSPAAAGH
ncbi:efflux RND transporter periplasmic adaptor subunit [Paraburkholderia acidisoli]|uniref:Efflux RND transporter periplasmic adaptor subunit n=1 Tax=Paraburkholderia acidisoli TaxID=2571748 RepID=A0A7Z2GPY9_9BURK|nr:efflux RND transporter periplasmic adaptor subunit [Paraburkholderia acidisoli]